MSDRFPLGFFAVEQFVFARLDEDAAQPGADLERVAALRLLAASHSIWVDDERVSHWKCFTCSPSQGAPCLTLMLLAHLWHAHPDLPDWAKGTMGGRGTELIQDAADAGGWFALAYPHHKSA